MNFDARTDSSLARKQAFVAWLADETVSTLRRAAGDREGLKAAVFLYLNRAYEAGLPAEEIINLLGVDSTSALSRASLAKKDEESVLAAFEELDELIAAAHSQSSSN